MLVKSVLYPELQFTRDSQITLRISRRKLRDGILIGSSVVRSRETTDLALIVSVFPQRLVERKQSSMRVYYRLTTYLVIVNAAVHVSDISWQRFGQCN